LFTNPSLALGEAYTNGTLTIKDADLYDFLDLIGRNMELSGLSHLKGTTGWINWLLRRLQQWNTAGWLRFNAARHYDFSGDLYDLFLDADTVIPLAVERLSVQPSKIANTRNRNVDQPVKKFVHPFASQRDLATDRYAFP